MTHDDNSTTGAVPAEFPLAQIAAPADEVVAELKNSALPVVAQACMAALSVGELGAWHYDWSPFLCLYGFHRYTGSLDGFPVWDGAPVIIDGRQTETHAAGVWQDQPETYRRIAAQTGRAAFHPQDQIYNNWALAVADFGRRGGGDLAVVLQAAGRDTDSLAAVASKLYATWPGGASAAFPARYVAALELFGPAPPGPVPLPVPTPAPAPAPIMLRPGMQVRFPVVGSDQDGQPYLPDDALVSDDLAVCTVEIADGVATITAIAAGRTLVHGADLVLTVVVEPRRLVHLVADIGKAVFSRPAALAAMLGLGLMMPGALTPDPAMTFFTPAAFVDLPAAAKLTAIAELPDPMKPTFCLVGVGREVRAGAPDECGGQK